MSDQPVNLDAVAKRTPVRVQLRRSRGWRKPECAIVVARPSRFGNPFRVDVFGLDRCLALYEESLHGGWNPAHVADVSDDLCNEAYRLHREFQKRFPGFDSPADCARRELAGHDLCCWCPPSRRCHVDALLRVCNSEVIR